MVIKVYYLFLCSFCKVYVCYIGSVYRAVAILLHSYMYIHVLSSVYLHHIQA